MELDDERNKAIDLLYGESKKNIAPKSDFNKDNILGGFKKILSDNGYNPEDPIIIDLLSYLMDNLYRLRPNSRLVKK